MNTREFEPITPGEILREEFLLPLNMTPDQLAQGLQVPSHLVRQVLDGQHPITAELAVRLGLFFQMEALFWLNLQTRYEFLCVQNTWLDRLQLEVRPYQAAPLLPVASPA